MYTIFSSKSVQVTPFLRHLISTIHPPASPVSQHKRGGHTGDFLGSASVGDLTSGDPRVFSFQLGQEENKETVYFLHSPLKKPFLTPS